MNKALMLIVSIAITAVVIGGGVYLFFNSRYQIDKNNLQNQIDGANKKIVELQTQISNQGTSANSTSTNNSTSATASESLALMSVCQDKNPGTTCTVEKIDGNYATGSTSSQGAGAIWYAQKQNNIWSIVTTAQDAPSCSLTSTFPKTIVPECGNY